eukprot:CAMPEP_0180769562 /NCGR_PEP_ID=MMETSP1038_2-20121128/41171_1 /TAXON_ID=632150 /ORGANISM="Azadinium spinosum, Strain 3D9" /LENGTH=303 /DNA_ID=CAMNT_0022804301 /DNA_START=1 /DNA_END=909 /DNA_ORIENTATION=+
MPSGKKGGSGRKALAAAVSSADAAERKMKGAGAELLERLEEQVEKLDKLAEDYLEQGLLGHNVEALQMRDKAAKTLEDMQKKLGIAPSKKERKATTSTPAATAPVAPAAARVPEVSEAVAAPAGTPNLPKPTASGKAASNEIASSEAASSKVSSSKATGSKVPNGPISATAVEREPERAAGESLGPQNDSDVWHGAAAAAMEMFLPRYRWRSLLHKEGSDGSGSEDGTVLEVCGLAGDGGNFDELEVDMAEGAIRLDGQTEQALTAMVMGTLPLGFLTDLAMCRVLRRRRAGRLTLEIPRAQA